MVSPPKRPKILGPWCQATKFTLFSEGIAFPCRGPWVEIPSSQQTSFTIDLEDLFLCKDPDQCKLTHLCHKLAKLVEIIFLKHQPYTLTNLVICYKLTT